MSEQSSDIIKRRPDVSYFSEVDTVKSTPLDGCIDFTIQNNGESKVWYGFTKDSKPDIPLEPGDMSTFPLYRSCEVWTGELFIRFGEVTGTVMVIKTL